MLNEDEIRKTIAIMKPAGKLFEIRIIYENKKVYSGYFRDADTLICELRHQNQVGCNVYMTLNILNDACYDRSQRNVFEGNSKTTTSDNDVVGLEWLMVDLDPKRPAGTSSSDEQIEKAKALGNKIYGFMGQIGFEKPLTAFSGNGVHLLYRVALKNTSENVKLLEKSLKTLNMLFEDDETSVDMKNFNPARVCKLYGTLAQKGSNTDQRPHRMSCITGSMAEIKPTDKKYLEKLCELYPKEPDKPQRYNNYNPGEFDLEEWMSKYGLRYEKKGFADGAKYILEHCPFDRNHKGKDACIFRSRSGAIGFHCFHNSCAGKTWQDVRVLFEPDAYEKKYQEQNRQMYGSFNRNRKPEAKPIVPQEGKPVWYTAKAVLELPKVAETFIKTGTTDIDKRLRGLKKGYVTVVSGLRGSAKSTLLSQWILDAIDTGNNVGCYSGELSEKNFMRWMNLQAAGKAHVEPSKFEGYYNVPHRNQEQIADWLGEHFLLYNNAYGNDFLAVAEQVEKVIQEKKLDMLVLDNLMSFDIRSLSDNKFDAQTAFVLKLQDIAKRTNVHILFVAHPRKAMGFLRLDDISGTADLGNAVDNAFIVHRNNNDFRRLSAQMFGWKADNPVYMGTNVVEIAKDRDGGIQDCFVPLYYEMETKRLKNHKAENRIYGWDKSDGFVPAENWEIPFD